MTFGEESSLSMTRRHFFGRGAKGLGASVSSTEGRNGSYLTAFGVKLLGELQNLSKVRR